MNENTNNRAKTVGELRAAGWVSRTIKEELATNVAAGLAAGADLFPGVMGYDDSAIPEIVNAVLAGHDIIILGERGQAKSRLIRAMVDLLDEYIPVVEGCEINDDPYAPVCRECRLRLAELGDELPVAWLHREERFGEKLATPDLSMADVIGDVDPIKVAEGKYLSDERVIHFGLLPRVNRGIFAINELPDLAERVQVGLFNVLEERDVQIKGFKVRLPLDVLVVATANPEDYTHRGRIVTPLKDRYSSHVRTHYPRRREQESAIVLAEAKSRPLTDEELIVPDFVLEAVIGVTFEARQSPEVSQTSGVSVRMSIANYEAVVANARRRAIMLGERQVVPRVSDLSAVVASSRGKLELDYQGEDSSEEELISRLVARSVKGVFDAYFAEEDFGEVVAAFNEGAVMEAGARLPAEEYADFFENLPKAKASVGKLKLGATPGEMAAAAELILEGLHLNKLLNRDQLTHGVRYKKFVPKPRKQRVDDESRFV